MTFLNLRNSIAFFALLSITLPVSGRNIVNIQRVPRNDPRQDYQQVQDHQAAEEVDVTATTMEPLLTKNEEILVALELENVDSSTVSPLIQDDANPLVSNNVEIVTSSSLDKMDDVAESDAIVKLEDPSVDPQIVEVPYHNGIENLPTELSEAHQLSPEVLADPVLEIDSINVSAPVLDSEPIRKQEDPFADPVTDSAPVSDETVEPIAENPSIDSVVDSAPILDEVESAEILQNPSVDSVAIAVPISEETFAEIPSADPVIDSVPVSVETVEPAQILEDPSVDYAAVAAPVSDEIVEPIAENPSIDPVVDSSPVLDEVEPTQILEEHSVDPMVELVLVSDKIVEPIAENPSADPVVDSAQILEDPSGDPAAVAVPISDEIVEPIAENPADSVAVAVPISEETVAEIPSADPVVVSAPISDQVELTQKLEDPSVETEQISAIEDFPVKVPTEDTKPGDLPPSSPHVFVSAVSPDLPIIITTLAPLHTANPVVSSPIAEKVKVSPYVTLTATGALSNVKPASNPCSTGKPKVTQSTVKQPAVYSKPVRPLVSANKPQVPYKYHSIISSSPPSIKYGPPLTSTYPQSLDVKNSFPTRPFGSSPKPRQLGFPPISSTRDNVLLEVNWAGKIGRPYRRAKSN